MKLRRFYFKHIEAIFIIGAIILFAVFILALMEWLTNSFPVVSLLICCLILLAANKLTKRKAL